MMKMLIELLCLASLFSLSISVNFDHINVDEIMGNQILYKKYFDCLANTGKCTDDGKELKEVFPEVIASGCEKCTEKQKKDADKVLRFIMENKPEDFSVLEKIYDPNGFYRKKYAAEAEKRGVKQGV